MCWIFVKRTYLRVCWRSTTDLCLMNLPRRSSLKVCGKCTPWVKFYFGLSLHIYLWKMRATPGACVKPGCLAWRPLCHKVNLPASCEAQRLLCHRVNLPSCVPRRPLFHKVNLPRCEGRRHHFILTCDIFGTGQTNTLALCYLFGKTWPAHSSATQQGHPTTVSS